MHFYRPYDIYYFYSLSQELENRHDSHDRKIDSFGNLQAGKIIVKIEMLFSI